MKTIKLPEQVIKYAPWSPSTVNKALECGFSFRCKVDKKTKTNFPDDSDAKVGTAIHQYVEELLKNPGLANDKNLLVSIYGTNQLTSVEVMRVNLLRESAINSVKRMKKFQEAHDVENLQLELELAVDLDLQPTKFFGKNILFRGKVDLAMMSPTGLLFIVDHKSGSKIEIDDAYKFQLTSYILLYVLGYLGVENIDKFKSGTIYLNALGGETPNIINGGTLTAEEFEDKVITPWVEKLILAAESADRNEPKEGYYCKFCSFQGLCPLKVNT